MIKTFKCKETERIWKDKRTLKFPISIQDRAFRKLYQLEASSCLQDLKVPPSNHLEALKGDRKGQWSIRINQQWRICFKWQENEA